MTSTETHIDPNKQAALATGEMIQAVNFLTECDADGVSSGIETGRRYFDQGTVDLRGMMEHLATANRGFETSEKKVSILVGFLARQRETERGEQ